MNVRTLLVIVLSVVCGVAAALGVNQLGGEVSAAPKEVETEPIIVPVLDIHTRGVLISKEMLAVKQIPLGVAPREAYRSIEDVINKTTRGPLYKDTFIMPGNVGEGRGLVALIEENGWRGFTIATRTDSAQVAGLIMPGNRVDISLTTKHQGNSLTSVILQNVRVLAVDQLFDAPEDNRTRMRNVTLLVDTEQYQRLQLAQSEGELTLALRGETDHAIVETRPMMWRGIEYGSDYAVDGLLRDEPKVPEETEEPKEPETKQPPTPPAPLEPQLVVPPIRLYRGNNGAVVLIGR